VLQDRVPEVAKSISRALYLSAVLAHGQVALLERPELGVKLEGTSLGVPEELSLEGKPDLVRGGTQSPHDVLQV
jgi:hypothetical protein